VLEGDMSGQYVPGSTPLGAKMQRIALEREAKKRRSRRTTMAKRERKENSVVPGTWDELIAMNKELTRLREFAQQVKSILWLSVGNADDLTVANYWDPDNEWDPETIEYIATAAEEAGLKPAKRVKAEKAQTTRRAATTKPLAAPTEQLTRDQAWAGLGQLLINLDEGVEPAILKGGRIYHSICRLAQIETAPSAHDIIDAISALIDVLAKMDVDPSTRCARKDGHSCLSAKEGKRITWGRPLTKSEYDYLCSSCRAYWHASAARNDVMDRVRGRR
jgi:hypothetical protein